MWRNLPNWWGNDRQYLFGQSDTVTKQSDWNNPWNDYFSYIRSPEKACLHQAFRASFTLAASLSLRGIDAGIHINDMVPVTMHFCFSKRILQQAEGQETAAAKCFLLCGAARGDAAVRIGCRCNFNPATALPDFPTACRVRSRDAIRVDCSNHSGSSASGETGLKPQNAESGLLK